MGPGPHGPGPRTALPWVAALLRPWPFPHVNRVDPHKNLHQMPPLKGLPSRGLTYPTLGKGKSSTQNAIFGGYVSFLDNITHWFPLVRPYFFGPYFWGGVAFGGAPLDSHDIFHHFPILRFRCFRYVSLGSKYLQPCVGTVLWTWNPLRPLFWLEKTRFYHQTSR